MMRSYHRSSGGEKRGFRTFLVELGAEIWPAVEFDDGTIAVQTPRGCGTYRGLTTLREDVRRVARTRAVPARLSGDLVEELHAPVP